MVKYHCDYCSKDISYDLRIKCAVCTDFDLCIECFSVGVEIQLHRNDHAYQVMDQLNFPVFKVDWAASEELLLLEGIEIYGMGNWIDIAEHVATKTPNQCQEHYFEVYVNSETAYPVPTEEETFSLPPPPSNDSKKKKAEKKKKTNTKANNQNTTQHQSLPVSHELGGYMVKRGEFETEYDNEAELTISEMSFADDDLPLERELKLQLFHIYNRRIDKRIRVRKFVVSHHLHDAKKRQNKERRRTKEEKEIFLKTRALLQCAKSSEEYEELVKGIALEKTLRKRLEVLTSYRKKGIRTTAECELFEQEYKREKEISSRKEKKDIYVYSERPRGERNTRRDKEHLEILSELKQKRQSTLNANTGIELLSAREKELCTNLRIAPSKYVMIKDAIVVDNVKYGTVSKQTRKNLGTIADPAKINQIFEFFVNSHWVPKPSED